MIGMIRYTATVATPARSPYQSPDFYAALAQGDTYAIGDTVEILLDWRYKKLQPIEQENRHLTMAASSVGEVVDHGTQDGQTIVFERVLQTRIDGVANDHAVMEALRKHFKHSAVEWFEDYENYPNESQVVLAKRCAPATRERDTNRWTFSFDVLYTTNQTDRVIPAFALAGTY